MPTYEYECTKCGVITEEFKPMSAPRRQRCPECRGKVGFYVNDSRGKMSSGSQDKPAPAAGSENKAGEKSD